MIWDNNDEIKVCRISVGNNGNPKRSNYLHGDMRFRLINGIFLLSFWRIVFCYVNDRLFILLSKNYAKNLRCVRCFEKLNCFLNWLFYYSLIRLFGVEESVIGMELLLCLSVKDRALRVGFFLSFLQLFSLPQCNFQDNTFLLLLLAISKCIFIYSAKEIQLLVDCTKRIGRFAFVRSFFCRVQF